MASCSVARNIETDLSDYPVVIAYKYTSQFQKMQITNVISIPADKTMALPTTMKTYLYGKYGTWNTIKEPTSPTGIYLMIFCFYDYFFN